MSLFDNLITLENRLLPTKITYGIDAQNQLGVGLFK